LPLSLLHFCQKVCYKVFRVKRSKVIRDSLSLNVHKWLVGMSLNARGQKVQNLARCQSHLMQWCFKTEERIGNLKCHHAISPLSHNFYNRLQKCKIYSNFDLRWHTSFKMLSNLYSNLNVDWKNQRNSYDSPNSVRFSLPSSENVASRYL